MFQTEKDEEINTAMDNEDDIVFSTEPNTPGSPPAIQPPTRSISNASETPSRTSSSCSIKRSATKRSRESMMETAYNALTASTQDEFDAVGSNVACKLRRMNENQRAIAELIINKTIIFGVQDKLIDASDVVLDSTNYQPQLFRQPLDNSNNNFRQESDAYPNYNQNSGLNQNQYGYQQSAARGPAVAVRVYPENTEDAGSSYRLSDLLILNKK